MSEYDKYYVSFQDKLAEIQARQTMLQEAEDNYYMTATYLLELAQKAHELFTSSELEEKRQLIALSLSNLRVDDEFVRYDLLNPFNTIAKYADRQSWLPG